MRTITLSRQARLAGLLLATVLVVSPVSWAESAVGSAVIDGMEIHQLESRLLEGNEGHWVVRLDKWPVKTGTEGYRPAGTAPTTWSPQVEFRWRFGDGTGWISTGAKPGVTHVYEERGSYTLEVEAVSSAGRVPELGPEQMTVEVADRDLRARTIDAIEIDPSRGLYELTADVYGDDDDERMEIIWKLDGRELARGPWREHWRLERVIPANTHDISAEWVAEDGSRSEKTVRLSSRGPRGVSQSEPQEDALATFDAAVLAEGVRTRLEGTMAGALAGGVQAEVRPFVGVFLGAPSKGPCRFQMIALDPERLMLIELMANLPDLAEEGRRYRFPASIVKLATFPDAETYLSTATRTGFNESVLGGLGNLDQRVRDRTGESAPSEEQINERLREEGGLVQYGPREGQYVMVGQGPGRHPKRIDANAPAAVSPFEAPPYDDHYGFQGLNGSVELLVVPHQRVVGVLDLELEGGSMYDQRACRQGRPYIGYPPRSVPGTPGRHKVTLGVCKSLQLHGNLVLDLQAAPRDGVVMYEGCRSDPRPLAIEAIYGPRDGEKNVWEPRPRVMAKFNRAVDPATLNESTFQLTYRDRSGRVVPVATRLHRDPDSAFLKPVDELWGGVRYTAQVRTGEDGVRGYDGSVLEGGPEDGRVHGDWYEWDFWTRVDFVPEEAGPENLSCSVYQTVRDAPLIRGKPAVAVVEAKWVGNPRVDRDEQTRELPARVVLEQRSAGGWEELKRVEQSFFRPPSANWAVLPFTPDDHTPETLRVSLELETREGWKSTHQALCSTPVWKHQPVLAVEVAVPLLADEGTRHRLELLLEELPRSATELFPFRRVDVGLGDPLEMRDLGLVEVAAAFADESEARRLMLVMARARARQVGPSGETHVVAGLYRSEDHGRTHAATMGFREGVFPAYLVQNLGRVEENLPETDLLLHQLGHALGLPDVPVNESDPEDFGNEVSPGPPIYWHDGIDGLAAADFLLIEVSREGRPGLLPIMHPNIPLIGVPEDSDWDLARTGLKVILRHHYLQVQEMIEDSGGLFDP